MKIKLREVAYCILVIIHYHSI